MQLIAPLFLQDHFILIVSEFLYLPRKFAQEAATDRAFAMGDLCTPSITASAAEILESQMTEFLKKKVLIYHLNMLNFSFSQTLSSLNKFRT